MRIWGESGGWIVEMILKRVVFGEGEGGMRGVKGACCIENEIWFKG